MSIFDTNSNTQQSLRSYAEDIRREYFSRRMFSNPEVLDEKIDEIFFYALNELQKKIEKGCLPEVQVCYKDKKVMESFCDITEKDFRRIIAMLCDKYREVRGYNIYCIEDLLYVGIEEI